MNEDLEPTYRLVALGDRENVGQTAASAVLAKLVPGDLDRSNHRLGIERTDWVRHFDKLRAHRTTLIEAEDQPGQWTIGV